MRKLLLGVSLWSICASVSFGATINIKNVAGGLWSTGLNTSGGLLTGGSVDPHYVLIPPATCSGAFVGLNCSEDGTPINGFGPSSYVVLGSPGTYPFNGVAWVANNDANSQWLGPRADQTNPAVGGTTFPNVEVFGSNTEFYVYRLVFNLTALGVNPATANIALQWISDNNSNFDVNSPSNAQIRLCSIASATDPVCGVGSTIPSSGNPGQSSPTLSAPINISGVPGGLVALDFIVYNAFAAAGANPSGVRVNVISATASDIPEPSTLLLVGAGLIAAGFTRRKL